MVDSEVCRLGVVVAPGSEVIISLAGTAVHLDLDSPNLHHHIVIIIIISSCRGQEEREAVYTYWRSTIGGVSSNLEVVSRSEGSSAVLGQLVGQSDQGLLLQDKHGVGGGGRSQAEQSESDLHVGLALSDQWCWTEGSRESHTVL